MEVAGGTVIIDGAEFIGTVGVMSDMSVAVSGGRLTMNGGSFGGEIQISDDYDQSLADLLGEGYAFRSQAEGTAWISDVSGKKISNVTVEKIPVQITDQPVAPAAVKYGYESAEDQTLQVAAATVPAGNSKELTYQWKVSTDSGENWTNVDTNYTGGTTAQCIIPTGLALGSYEYTCDVTCDGYTVTTTPVTFTVNKADGVITPKAEDGYATNYTYNDTYIPNPKSGDFTTNAGALSYTWYQGYPVAAGAEVLSSAPKDPGTYTLRISAEATDNVPAVTRDVKVTISYLENDAVATLGETNQGNNGWYTGQVTVNAPDGYTISNNTNGSFGESFTTTTNGDVTYYLKENVTGYRTDAKTIAVKYDVDKPTISTISYSTHQSFLDWIFGKSSIEVTVPVADTTSGADHIAYTLTADETNGTLGGNVDGTANVESNGNATFTISKDFKGSISITAYDKAGNAGETATAVRMAVEETAPTVSVTDKKAEGSAFHSDIWYNTAQTLYILAQDTDSGLQTVSYTVDGGASQNLYTAPSTEGSGLTTDKQALTLTAQEGTHTYHISATDNALNITTVDVTISQDSIVPANPTLSITTAATDTTVTLTAGVTEESSGVKEYTLTEATGKIAVVSNATGVFSLTGLTPNTEYSFTVTAKDNAENVSVASAPVSVKTQKQSLQTAVVTLTDADGFVYDQNSHVPTVVATLNEAVIAADQYTVIYTNSNTSDTNKASVYAGTVTVTIQAKSDGNYSGSTAGQEAGTKTYVIAPKPVTATVIASNKTYDGTTTANVTATAATDITEEILTITGVTGAFTDATAAENKTVNINKTNAVVAGGTNTTASNYIVTIPETATASISKAEAAITIASGSETVTKTFGDESFTLSGISKTGDGTLTYEVSDSKNAASTGVADDKVITVDQEGSVSITGAGTATITVKMAATTNYNEATFKTISITVNKQTLVNGTAGRSYAYAAGSGDTPVTIPVAEAGNLPENRGGTSYALGTVTDVDSILVADSCSVDSKTGVLAYQVAKEKEIGNTASIPVIVSMENYADYTYTLTIQIVDKTAVELKSGSEVSVTGSNTLTYGEALSQLTLGSAVFVEQGTDTQVSGTLAWTNSETVPEVGTTTAEWTFTPDNKAVYAPVTGNVDIVVNKAQGIVENKAAAEGYQTAYTYTGNQITAPVSTNFTANSGNNTFTFTWYRDSVSEANKLSDGTRPLEKGTYILKADVAETANYTDASTTLTVKIGSFVPSPAVSATLADTNLGTDSWYGGDVTVLAPADYTISTVQTGSFGGSVAVVADQNGDFTYYLKQDTTGYITDAMTITVNRDTTVPTAKITVKEKWWQSFLTTVSFGLYTNTMDTITIDAKDNDGTAKSGINTVEYYISSTSYVGDAGLNSLKASEDVVWNTYSSNSRPQVTQDTVSYVYARVKDKAGNVTYVSTDGIVYDTTAPTLTVTPSGNVYAETAASATPGITAYTGTVTMAVTATDNAAEQNTLDSIKYVLDNGAEKAITSGGNFQITGRGNHTVTVTATDNAGNTTPQTLNIRIYGEVPALTLTPVSSIVYDGAVIAEGTDFTLNKGGSIGEVTYFHKVNGTADDTYVSGLPVNAGSYTIKASIAEDSTGCYPATEQTHDLTIAKATPSIHLETSVSRAGGTSIVLTATLGKVGNGALPSGSVTFYDTTTGSEANIATKVLAEGTASDTYPVTEQKVFKLKAVYAGDDNYNSVTSTEQSIDTAKQNQAALSINGIAAKTYGDGTFTLSTTGGSGTGAVTFTSSKPSIVSIDGNTATIHKAGSVTITATKAANDEYNETTAQTSLTIGKKALTFTAENKLNVIIGSAMPTLTYATAGLVTGDSITTEPTMSVSAENTNTLGEFSISISGAVVTNADSYNVSYVNGIMTIVKQLYTVNVTDGTASVDGTGVSQASEGQVLTVKASDKSGYTFKNWSSNAGGSFANASAKTTTFIMPANAVTITANYTKNSSSDSGNNSDNGDSGSTGTTTTPTQTTTPTGTEAPFIQGKNGEQGWEAITSYIADTFTQALETAGVDVSAITDDAGKVDLEKLTANPEVLEALSGLSEPLAVTVDMNGATELPADIITLIAGKNIDLTLDMGEGISWTINGNSVTGENFTNINLDVTKNADKIPLDIVNEVSGDNYSMQIELSHNGEFGFTATLNINLEKANAGSYANLFYFNEETGKLEFMGTSQIDENGNAALDFVHASAYTIVVSAEPMSAENVENAEENENTAEEKQNNADADSEGTTVEASEETSGGMMALWIILGIVVVVAIGGGVYLMKRKKESEE